MYLSGFFCLDSFSCRDSVRTNAVRYRSVQLEKDETKLSGRSVSLFVYDRTQNKCGPYRKMAWSCLFARGLDLNFLKVPASAIMTSSVLNIMLSLVTYLAVFILKIIESTRDIGRALNNLFLIFPQVRFQNMLILLTYHWLLTTW